MEQKWKDFLQSSFLTEVTNTQTTTQMRNVQFEARCCSEETVTALWICRFIDAQLPPQIDALQSPAKHLPSACLAGAQYSVSQDCLPSNGSSPKGQTARPFYPHPQGQLSCPRNSSVTAAKFAAQHTQVNGSQFVKFTTGILKKTYYSRREDFPAVGWQLLRESHLSCINWSPKNRPEFLLLQAQPLINISPA